MSFDDTQSRISETDYELFAALANRTELGNDVENVDSAFAALRDMIGAPAPATTIEELPDSGDESDGVGSADDSYDGTDNDDAALSPSGSLHDTVRNLNENKAPETVFSQAMRQFQNPPPTPTPTPAQVPVRPPSPAISVPRPVHAPPRQPTSRPGASTSAAPPSDGAVNWQRLFADTEYVPEDFSDINVDVENKNPKLRREKQEILFQLLKMYPSESKGQWNMKMPLFELKYELLRREQFQEEQDQLMFMKNMMKMILTGIEMANEKFGPFLELKGWSKEVTKDMNKYDRSLKALYHRYFRKKQMNPIMELLWLIVGSAAMWHIQVKFLGGPPASTEPPVNRRETQEFFNNMHDIKPPPGGGRFPFAQPGAAQGLGGGGAGGINLANLLKLFVR